MYSRDNFEIGLTGIEFFFIPVDIVRTLPPLFNKGGRAFQKLSHFMGFKNFC